MKDTRAKKSSAEWPDELVTDDFIAAVRKLLLDNEALNEIDNVNEGESGYRIDSRAALARALSRLLNRTIGDKHVSDVIGPAREGSKWDRVERSALVRPIATLLRMPLTVRFEVPEHRAEAVRAMLEMDEDLFQPIAAAIRDRVAKLK